MSGFGRSTLIVVVGVAAVVDVAVILGGVGRHDG